MCGIAGFIDSQLSADVMHTMTFDMLKQIVHRGPEDSSVYIDGPVALGHNRLKIIDLSDEANQPFEYQDVVVAFNGEIYNYIEVRQILLQKGYSFRTQGDTEVLCAAYKYWGESCVEQFMGMWAFALWDKTQKKLFCSRDRFGIKPFYYYTRGQHLYFGSEYKALKTLPHFCADINREQINRGLQIAWTGFQQETFYATLKSLEPSYNLVWQNGTIQQYKYWDIDFSKQTPALSFEEKKEKFYTLFSDSVRLHARSDVPNGTCLSGGLDSSAISGMYSKLLPESKLKSFTVYFEDGVDERPFVRDVVNKYPNLVPYYYTPTGQEISDHFHHMAYHADTPVLGSSYISHYFLMKLAKSEGVTVVIDGQGSDEMLGGYLHSFYRIIGQHISSFQWLKANNLLHALSERENFSAKRRRDFLLRSVVSAFSNEKRMYNLELSQLNKYLMAPASDLDLETKTSDKFNNFLYHLLFNTTLQPLLHYEDRNSMAFSLESRVPFLNHHLAEFAFTLHSEDKINARAETKYILRESLKDVLPQRVYERKDKKGFVTPGEVKWLNGPLSFLLDIDYSRFDWMKKEELIKLVNNYRSGDISKAGLVWRIACTHYWLKNFA
ncbi:MAG: asparagine synthase (glutamine-hydrolyzing) [Bacteroidetes bacterium]|nr:asparagine synthase (glutamine-hydrolyzing) [Bacteroidota bacterium]